MLKFFRAGVSPVPLETTLEIFGFMAAADENKRHVGAAVSLVDVLKARNAQR